MTAMKKTLSVLLAMLLVAVILPWGDMRVKAAESATVYDWFVEDHPSYNTYDQIDFSNLNSFQTYIYYDEDADLVGYSTDSYLTRSLRAVYEGSQFTEEEQRIIHGYGTGANNDIYLKAVTVTPAYGTDPDFVECVYQLNSVGACQVKVYARKKGTGTVQISYGSKTLDDKGIEKTGTRSFDFVVEKVIKEIQLKPWLLPKNSAPHTIDLDNSRNQSNADIRKNEKEVIKIFEGLAEDGKRIPDYSATKWTAVGGSGYIDLTSSSSGAAGSITIKSKSSEGIATVQVVPERDLNGQTGYNPDNTDIDKTTNVVVASINTPSITAASDGKKIMTVYEGQTVPSPAVITNGAGTPPIAMDYNWKFAAPDASLPETTVPASLKNKATDANVELITSGTTHSIKGLKATDELIRITAKIIGNGYYYPEVIQTDWYVRVLPVPPASLLIPPKAVNKDCDAEHGYADADVIYISGTSDGSGGTLPVSDDCKGVIYTVPSNSTAEPVKTAGRTTGVKGKAIGFSSATGTSSYDNTKKDQNVPILVVQDLEMTVGETGKWFSTPNLVGLPDGYTVVFGTPENNDGEKITVSERGMVTANKATGSTPVSVPVTITRTETGKSDSTVCHVTVKKKPVTVKADSIRYTGRKLQNPLTLSFVDIDYGGSESAADAITESILKSADWTSANGKSTFSSGKLTPKGGYGAAGNEKLTAPVTFEDDSYELSGGKAALNVDIYGYEFTGKTSVSYTKTSKKDVVFTIELYDDFAKAVTPDAGFVPDADIYDKEFVRIELLDKDEKPLSTPISLAKGGAKEGTNYHYKSGSVVLTLEDTFLDTLDYGTYKLIGYFTPSTEDGNEVDTLNVATLKIEKPIIPNTDVSTKDAARVGGVALLFGTSLGLLLWLRKKRRKREYAAAYVDINSYGRF